MKAYAKAALALVLAFGVGGCGGGVDPGAMRIVDAMPPTDWDSFCENYTFTQAERFSDDRTFQYMSDGESTFTVTGEDGIAARAIYEALKTRC